MSEAIFYQDDVGQPIVYELQDRDGTTIPANTTSARAFVFLKPDGETAVSVTPEVFTDTDSKSKLRWYTDGSFDQWGEWQLQPQVTLNSDPTATISFDPVQFRVAKKLGA